MPADGSALNGWTATHESAECLYVMLASLTMEDGKSGLSLVASNEIGDTDGDGRKEILDAFGNPLIVDLVHMDRINDDGTWVTPGVDPHIDPEFDPTALPAPDLPDNATKYQLIISSANVSGKL